MKKLVLLFIVLLSCTATAREKIRVACIGDSITFGAVLSDRATNSYPSVLQGLLGDKYEVRNFGNSGRCVIKTSKRGSQPRAYFFMKEHQDALEFKPNIVICNLGINDLMDYEKKFAEFVPDYKELLNQYRELETNPKILVWHKMSPLMQGQRFYGSATIAKINGAIEETVKQLNTKKLRKKYRSISTIDMSEPLNDPMYFTSDKIHPNELGAKKIAEETYKKLKKRKKRRK